MAWYEHGLEEGLYVNPDLDYTITHEFQNETIPDIIDMAHSVDGFDINEFFKGTIYRGFSLEDFEMFYENGVTDMSELSGFMPLMLSFDRSVILTATADETFKYFKIPAYGTAHGALYRLSMNGRNGLCINYGKHAPNGTRYYVGEISKYATNAQMENIKMGLLFSLYSYNNDIGNTSAWRNYGTLYDIPIGSWTYLMAQVWTWCAMLNLSPMECAQQFAAVLLDWGSNNEAWAESVLFEANNFLSNRLYEYYSVDTTLYTSNNDANQVIFVYDFESLRPMQEVNPVIKTSAINKVTKMTQAEASTMVTISDAISYTDLIPGKEYTVTGKLMLRDTGSELKINGRSITATKKFTPTAKNGTVNMEFTFDAAPLAGKTV
ncbi:MAG: VaFE repeat-containing surface-anchored protein, partial [Lachnospiraceae bacterium]|nr:VaFE repeat-containing surface-anchored protein [Candidatus Minthocola equi]